MATATDSALRKAVVDLVKGEHAHLSLEDAVKDFPIVKAGVRPEGSPHSAWELLEHIRIALDDIVRFSGVTATQKPEGKQPPDDYVELSWPDDYWPKSPAPESESAWDASVEAILDLRARFIKHLRDPQNNLEEPFPWGSGQTLLREAALIGNHNSYHLGQIVTVRKIIESR